MTDEVFMEVLASLVAAVSLLKAGGKAAAPSDKMFDQMIIDYERAIERGRSALVQFDAEPDSEGVTRKDVEGWMQYFDEHADEFVAAHEAIIRKAQSDAEPDSKLEELVSR